MREPSHSNEFRPGPDDLLAQIQAEEEGRTQGKLKIFLGYAAGVGKTYAMLEAARLRKKELDIVVAYVETHGRVETEALLEGLEIIPRKQVKYRDVMLPEMDLDAVLTRRPKLALVDEIAHTNAPESRHLKRYQDVEELLKAGIDVYTTLNIQHIESLRNVVAQITDVWVRETVPDSVVDNAAEIEIVDLPPDELLKRLKEGKVYIPEQIAGAIAQFFRKGNLAALRELTMRTAAQHVDEQMRDYMKIHTIPGPWPTAERILVCVSPGPLGNRLVRTARRLASQLRAEWFVAYVETSSDARLPPSQQDILNDTLRLANRLGAKTTTIHGHSIAVAIIEFAKMNNITKIIVGKPRRKGWRKLLSTSVVNQIIRQSSHFDVYVVSGSGERVKQDLPPTPEKFRNWRSYLQGLGLLVLATLLGQLITLRFSPTNVIIFYLLCVAITAIFWGLGPSILISVIATLAFYLFFILPFPTLNGADSQYLFTLFALLLAGVLISYFTSRIYHQTEAARRRAREAATLYALSRDMVVIKDLESYIRAIIQKTKETFGRDAVIFLPDTQNKETLIPHTEIQDFVIDEKEAAAAFWSFQHQMIVGHGTETLPNAKARYLPLITARGTAGVLALWPIDNTNEFTIEQERLLGTFADLAAVAIEGILMVEEARNTQISRSTEKLQAALLNSISQDLHTPLVSLITTLDSIEKEGEKLNDPTSKNLVDVARLEADTLNHMITNLLDMSRIEAGALRLVQLPNNVQDLISAALERFDIPGARPIKINIPPDLPFVSADFVLIVRALVDILDNAFKYSPTDSPIEIIGKQLTQQVEIDIADRGVGISPQDLLHVFEKFYRVQRPDNVPGTGLGLTICKGIIEAHGGHIIAENRPGGGTIIRLTLPTAKAAPKDSEKASISGN